MSTDYKKIIEHYGEDKQITVAVEELSELIKALCKYKRWGSSAETLFNIAEEIADVMIMCDQLVVMFGIDEEVEAMKKYKIKRTLERIENGK